MDKTKEMQEARTIDLTSSSKSKKASWTDDGGGVELNDL